jgi:hypothetical protein
MTHRLAAFTTTGPASLQPELISSSTLIVVVVVYMLFGAAGFLAAAQMV